MSIRWLADENFDNNLVRSLLLRKPGLDLARVQDVGLSGADDAAVLSRAAEEGRLVLTHDLRTMPAHAYRRIINGERVLGVFAVGLEVPIAVAIGDILLIDSCSDPEKWDGQVRFLPL